MDRACRCQAKLIEAVRKKLEHLIAFMFVHLKRPMKGMQVILLGLQEWIIMKKMHMTTPIKTKKKKVTTKVTVSG